jgi:cytochrome c oxidase assembly protein subunit 15
LLHRSTGYLVALVAILLALVALMRGRGGARKVALAVGGLALLQAALGVMTVLSISQLHVSLAHQFGAVLLWIGTLGLARSTR